MFKLDFSGKCLNFLSTAFVLAKDFSKDNSLHYVFMDWRHSLDLQLAFKDIYPKLLNICIWDKTKAGMGSFYRSQHEFCFIYQNGNGGYSNNIQLGKNGRNRSNKFRKLIKKRCYQRFSISSSLF